jgi:integrase/recombinase XerD
MYRDIMSSKAFVSQPKQLPKYVSKEVIEQAIDKANHDTGKHGRRNHLILTILWQTGIRAEELANLHKKDIQLDTLIVRGGKGGKDRVIPIKNETRNLLLVYSDQLKGEDRLFPISVRQVRNIVYKYSDLHPHTFRHSFAVHCLRNGMNLRALQKILGHSGLNTTQVYLDLVGSDLKDEYEKVKW